MIFNNLLFLYLSIYIKYNYGIYSFAQAKKKCHHWLLHILRNSHRKTHSYVEKYRDFKYLALDNERGYHSYNSLRRKLEKNSFFWQKITTASTWRYFSVSCERLFHKWICMEATWAGYSQIDRFQEWHFRESIKNEEDEGKDDVRS